MTRDELYSSVPNNGSFNADSADPTNTSTNGYLEKFPNASGVPDAGTVIRANWIKTLFYRVIKFFVHKSEDKTTKTDLGVDLDSTVEKYTTYEQLPEVQIGQGDFTVATVPSDANLTSNFDCFNLEIITTGKNKKFKVTLHEKLIKLIKQRTTPSSSLPLFWCHGKNVDGSGNNLGDGSIDNPFGTLDAVIAKIDADTTIKNYTVILLGGTFTTNQNIYRGCSFYGISGVTINYTGTNYLLTQRTSGGIEDVNANRKYDGNFYFTGDITVNISNGGGLSDLGFFTSNAAGTTGKQYIFKISNLNVTGSYNQSGTGATIRNFPIMLKYGAINSYDVNIDFTIASVSNIAMIEARKCEINFGGDSVALANSGVNLVFSFKNMSFSDNFIFLATGTDNADFYGRNIVVKGENIYISNPSDGSNGGKLFKGRFNRERKHIFNFSINQIIIANTNITGTSSGLIQQFGSDYNGGGGSQAAFFIFKDTLFTYNSAYPYVAGKVFIGTPNDSYIYVIFRNCLRSSNPTALYTTLASAVEKGYAMDGTKLDVSSLAAASLSDTTINN